MRRASCLSTIVVSILTSTTLQTTANEITARQMTGNSLTNGSESFPEVEKVLIPVLSRNGFPGRSGSSWVAELWARNSSDHDVLFGSGYLLIVLPPGYPAIRSRTTVMANELAERGAIFVLERAFADEVHLSLRIADVSRRPISQGTEVPVVRERDWLSRPIEFLDVPTGFAVRQMLRVYETDGTDETAVRVLVYPIRDNEPIAEAVLEPRGGARYFEGQTGAPAYAEIADLVERFPQIVAHERLRIRLEPLTPGMRYWAFVTITDNMTQEVTVVSPQ